MQKLGIPASSPIQKDFTAFAAANTDNAPLRTIKIPLDPSQLRKIPNASTIRNSNGQDYRQSTEGYCVGDRIHGFTLVEKIGEGSFSTVFLAEQESIFGRLVVLKITSQTTNEPDRLGQLQHPNIVPIYSVHRSDESEIICMPFLGRTTLERLLAFDRRIPTQTPVGSVGKSSRQSFCEDSIFKTCTQSHEPKSETISDAEISILGNIDQILTLLSDLASGLYHAHRRGILHLDIKPANVLISESGVPMLFDFNLSHTVGETRSGLGGTVPYMAPEQLEELIFSIDGRVDERTDLYGLGALAFELLTKELLFPTSGVSRQDLQVHLEHRREPLPSLRALNPAISPAVESIVWKLLDPNPEKRYQTALELKTDIDRHLENLPLVYASNRSFRERFAKWRKRNPKHRCKFMAAIVAVLSIVLANIAYRKDSIAREYSANALAADTHNQISLARLDLISTGDRQAKERGTKAALNILGQYGLPNDDAWQQRSQFRYLPEPMQKAVSADLGELLLLLAHSRSQGSMQMIGTDRLSFVREMTRLNDLAEKCFQNEPVPPFVYEQRNDLNVSLGGGNIVEVCGPPSGPRDSFLNAVRLMSTGKYSNAIPSLEKVIAGEPGHAAAHFSLAVCRHQLGQYSRALERYDTAFALLPHDPRPAFNRGIIYGLERKHAQAEAEFTIAIGIDPQHGESYRNRAVARMQMGQLKDAEADLTLALEKGSSPIEVYFIRSQVREKLSDHRGAENDRNAANSYDPLTDTDFIARGRSRLPLDPNGALEDFVAAERLNPRCLAAIQNQAHVLSDWLHNDKRALEAVTRAIEFYPEYVPARAGMAVLLARLGKREQAHREAELALSLSTDATISYQVAGVYARTAERHPEDISRAMELLRQAVRGGFRDARMMESDPDLATLRSLREFEELSSALKNFVRTQTHQGS